MFNRKFVGLIFVFVIPVIASWLLFYNHSYFKFKTVNHGHLINPPVMVQELLTKKRQWQIIFMPSNGCDAQCEKTAFFLHQVRSVLGKEQERVSLTLVTDQVYQQKNIREFRELVYSPEQYAKLGQQLHEPQNAVKNKIYLMDPLGNVFMYYESDANPMDVLKDLKKVLEVSQIG